MPIREVTDGPKTCTLHLVLVLTSCDICSTVTATEEALVSAQIITALTVQNCTVLEEKHFSHNLYLKL